MTVALKSHSVQALELPWPETMAAQLLRVKEVFKGLGLDDAELVPKEQRDSIRLQRSLWKLPSRPPSVAALTFLADLTFLMSRGVLELKLDGLSIDPQEIEEVLRSQDSSVELSLKLHKDRLLNLLGVVAPQCQFYLFLFGEALVNLLSVPMTKAEGEGGLFEQATGDRKIMILLADGNIVLDGPYLAVIGGHLLNRWKTYCPEVAPDACAVREFRKRALDPSSGVSWASSPPQYLTPLQLGVKWLSGRRGDPVGQAFLRKWIELALVYTANQATEGANGIWLCVFLGERSVGHISVGTQEAPVRATEILGELVRWVYTPGHQESDRLTMLRSIFADSFSEPEPADNYDPFLRRITSLNTTVRSGWDTFVRGKLKEYFELKRQLEELVGETQRAFQGHIQTLIKNMTESMLAGVGVVVGTFLGATLGSEFNADLFRLGLWVYAVYIASFPGLIGFRTVREQFKEERRSYYRRLRGFRDRLAEKDLAKVTVKGKIVKASERSFKAWRWAVGLIYAVAVSALLLAAWLVPSLV